MDNLKTLMDKRQYDLVLKLTEHSEDNTSLFYRMTSFIALAKPEEALSCYLEHRKQLEVDLPLAVKTHIELLCILGKFDEAYKELDYYETLPYHSQICEETLRSMKDLIRAEEKKALGFKNLNDDDLKIKLHKKDGDDAIYALDIIRDRDINQYLPDIMWVLVNHNKQCVRSFALLMLVQKKIDKVVRFNHSGKIIEVNPSKLEPPFVGDDFNNLLKKIDSTYKDVSLSQNAAQVLSSFLIYTYPDKIPFDDVLLEALYEISLEYFKYTDKPSLEERCKEKDISLEKVQKLIKKINEVIEDF